jgi:hypothetical protein
MIRGRRIMKMNKFIRGSFGIYKNEWIYEYSEIMQEWIGWPAKWYELKTK